MSKRRELNPNSPTDRKIADRRSQTKVNNVSHPRANKPSPRMSGLESKTIRGHFHNGRYVWG